MKLRARMKLFGFLRNAFKGKTQRRLVHLVSYPKSGNTWIRFILGTYICDEPVSFANYHKVIPDIHRNPEDIALVRHNPVIVKSHLPAQPEYEKVVYVFRDGRDVSVSYYYHLLGKNRIPLDTDFKKFYWEFFLPGKIYSGDWGSHVHSWLNRGCDHKSSVLFVKYEDLLTSTLAQVERIIRFCDIPLDETKLERAIALSSRENMAKDEEANRARSIEHKDVVLNNFKFVRKGVAGDWREYYDAEMRIAFNKKYGDLMKKLSYE